MKRKKRAVIITSKYIFTITTKHNISMFISNPKVFHTIRLSAKISVGRDGNVVWDGVLGDKEPTRE
jgi:hypothetical protein